MDEVENENLPKAGESPTLPPVDDASSGDDVKIPLDTAEVLIDSGNPSPTAPPAPSPQAETLPIRPGLKRESSVPAPSQPPPAPPTNQPVDPPDFPQEPPDSLTLADLKRIRAQFPNAQGAPVELKREVLGDQKVYDFEYADAQSFPVEIEEWFGYSEHEERSLRMCKSVFSQEWKAEKGGVRMDWLSASENERATFIKRQVDSLKPVEEREGTKPTTELMVLTYIALGVWDETAGRPASESMSTLFPDQTQAGSGIDDYPNNTFQIQYIVAMVDALHAGGALETVYDLTRHFFDEAFQSSPLPADPLKGDVQIPCRGQESVELWCCLTLMYLFVEVARSTAGERGKALKQDILTLEPKVLTYFTSVVAKLRWDDFAPVPFTKMLLLSWKCVLVTFGGIKDVKNIKSALKKQEGSETAEEERDSRGKPVITASPLDYHLFRQEISSKYPAYQAPPPMFPLEPDNNSILPPLRHRQQSIPSASESALTGAPSVGTHSIMHQPVHIATPAPSPPPSPAGPGKAAKKQNYQTNQMFPFLYPPLDGSSSELGGKGSTQLQDALVGRKWEGSDVPTSILEAAELFSKRMRATRGLKQLWEARVDYMKVERGWDPNDQDDDTDVDDFELVDKPEERETAEPGGSLSMSEEEKKLKMVDDFYRDSLPNLQSFVIVVLKFVQTAIGDIGVRNGILQPGIQFQDTNGVNGTAERAGNGLHSGPNGNAAEEPDKVRSQEIAQKALTGTVLLLLKWFKVNHVLQYEYLCQLLLDALCIPLTLKLWQQQEIGRLCHFRPDKEGQGFFYFCQTHSRQGPPLPSNPGGSTSFEEEEEESEDDAAPPPIKRTREAPEIDPSTNSDTANQLPANATPELDELGYPTAPLPPHLPLKQYNHRALLTTLNNLRILQKLTHRKTHRTLMLVSYKSTPHLKKLLKLPLPEIRLYTLKLFKSQVPFCGRKWRQSNMKIITAIYLSVPAELRDDWLSGGGGGSGGAGGWGDVDGSVEDAVPLEMALRGLTFWWNGRFFPEGMGGKEKWRETRGEWGFFEREVERLEAMRGLAGLGEVGEDGEGDEGLVGVEGEGMVGVGGNGGGWMGGFEGY
ncbi:Striatin-interacting protein 1 [Teratosphaeria destructans]|uniref:Striatin-interacting protein 1 n=1 Tax=Teratosphaeria destructans TaxID=418781 RepID=A0A9W7T1J3_9PEZI|nr:Striatin-interacting protein 1 [Teratosphaeria destructans]